MINVIRHVHDDNDIDVMCEENRIFKEYLYKI